MKILDFNQFKPLEKVLRKMGASPNREYSHQGQWKHISREEMHSAPKNIFDEME